MHLLNFTLRRLLFLVLFISTSISLSANSHLDQKKISLNFKDVPLSKIFEEIELQTPYKFFYKNEDVNLNRNVNIQVNEQQIEIALGMLFKADLKYKIKENKIILYKRMSNEVSGKIVDAKTNAPISFATVRIKDKGIGVIADIKGFFKIPIEYKDLGDTLKITSIGYQTKLIPLQNLDQDILNIVAMNESVESLPQVLIESRRKLTKKEELRDSDYYVNDIIRLAIENIPNNYPIEDHSYVGYYRDYQIRDEGYINLNEALMELFDAGFYTNKLIDLRNQTALYSYKPNYEFIRDTTTTIAYNNHRREFNIKTNASAFVGNEMSIVNFHDPIRNYNNKTFSLIDTLEIDFIKNHEFKLENEVKLDSLDLYQINFNSKDLVKSKKYFAEGELYVEKNNFAIHKIEYKVFRQYITKPPFIKYNREKDPFFNIKVEYSRVDNKMFLNYISFYNLFDVTKVKKSILRRIAKSQKLRVTNISYNPSNNAVLFEFNQVLNIKDMSDKKKYKIKYLGNNIEIDKIEIVDDYKLNVFLNKDVILNTNFDLENEKYFDYEIKGVKKHTSINDYYKRTGEKIEQFREFFVQQVNTEKTLPKDLRFMDKLLPISKNPINKIKDISQYWVNTPLKTIKENQ